MRVHVTFSSKVEFTELTWQTRESDNKTMFMFASTYDGRHPNQFLSQNYIDIHYIHWYCPEISGFLMNKAFATPYLRRRHQYMTSCLYFTEEGFGWPSAYVITITPRSDACRNTHDQGGVGAARLLHHLLAALHGLRVPHHVVRSRPAGLRWLPLLPVSIKSVRTWFIVRNEITVNLIEFRVCRSNMNNRCCVSLVVGCSNTCALCWCFRATSRLFYFSNVAVNVFIYAGRSNDLRLAFSYDIYYIRKCLGCEPARRPRHPSASSSAYNRSSRTKRQLSSLPSYASGHYERTDSEAVLARDFSATPVDDIDTVSRQVSLNQSPGDTIDTVSRQVSIQTNGYSNIAVLTEDDEQFDADSRHVTVQIQPYSNGHTSRDNFEDFKFIPEVDSVCTPMWSSRVHARISVFAVRMSCSLLAVRCMDVVFAA